MRVKLLPGAILPTRAHPADAGLDLYARTGATIYPGESATFDTGVCMELPKQTFGKIESRSGLNVKHGIVSCGGVIDSGYTGSIAVKLYNLSDEPYHVKAYERIAQLIILPYVPVDLKEVDELEETDRGSNGFGSSGR
jgi:dUTP pyrophosphatase